MAPQHRGIIPPTQAQRLDAARDAKDAADDEFRQAVVAALKAGGSIREVAELSGLSTRTVQTWGHENGWPTPAQKKARAEARERRKYEYERILARYAAEDAEQSPAD